MITMINENHNNNNNDDVVGVDYRGYLLAAHPRRRADAVYHHGVILVIDHAAGVGGISVGLQMNKIIVDSDLNLEMVMLNMGVEDYSHTDAPVFFGGDCQPNRISVVHSLDWSSANTNMISDQIGVSNDLSVLAAIANGVGPEYYRVVSGHARWSSGQLEGEITGAGPRSSKFQWIVCPPAEYHNSMIFSQSGLNLWHNVIRDAARAQVDEWFTH